MSVYRFCIQRATFPVSRAITNLSSGLFFVSGNKECLPQRVPYFRLRGHHSPDSPHSSARPSRFTPFALHAKLARAIRPSFAPFAPFAVLGPPDSLHSPRTRHLLVRFALPLPHTLYPAPWLAPSAPFAPSLCSPHTSPAGSPNSSWVSVASVANNLRKVS